MNAIAATTLVALSLLGGAAAIATPLATDAAPARAECTDVAGQADVCNDLVVDPAGSISGNVTVDIHPTIPPVAAASRAADCTDLAGQGSLCTEGDPTTGSFEAELIVSPTLPPL